MRKVHPTWLQVEKAIQKEIAWLKNNIFSYQPNKNPLNYSDDIFYRLIAILIVSGKITAEEYIYKHKYNIINNYNNTDKKHGADWHDGMINYLSKYFKDRNYVINGNEPKLYYGHADLKIEKDNNITYFEIDTVNIFKLYVNLKIMKKVKLIIITSDKIIKFEL